MYEDSHRLKARVSFFNLESAASRIERISRAECTPTTLLFPHHEQRLCCCGRTAGIVDRVIRRYREPTGSIWRSHVHSLNDDERIALLDSRHGDVTGSCSSHRSGFQ